MKTIISKNEEKNTVEAVDWLENIVRESARKMIAAALEDEVEQFIQQHLNRKDAEGHRLVVRNGYMPERQIMATCGNITIRQPRIDDSKLPDGGASILTQREGLEHFKYRIFCCYKIQ